MGITVNQDLLTDDVTPTGKPTLPDGVFDALEWDSWVDEKRAGSVGREEPQTRIELFRVNGRVYTAPTRFDPGAMFRYMRAVRKGGAGDDMGPVANLMYDVLGDAVMDALADEKLSEDEFRTVMKVVQKHTAGLAQRTLGK